MKQLAMSLLLLSATLLASPALASEAALPQPDCPPAAVLEPFPEPLPMGCFCGTGGITPSDVALSWGKGADCNAALANLDANTTQLADELCWNIGAEAACQLGAITITAECYFNEEAMMYQTDGYRTYKCLRCWEPPGPEPR